MFYDLARTNDMRICSDWLRSSTFEGARSRVVILAETGFRQRKNTLLGFVEARIKETLGLVSNASKKALGVLERQLVCTTRPQRICSKT